MPFRKIETHNYREIDGQCALKRDLEKSAWISMEKADAADAFEAPGDPLHTHEPVAVASFRTWRGWRDCVA
jgi:hypothetical protein